MTGTLASPLPSGFHALRVARVIDETHDTRSYELDVPEALRDAFAYQSGQFLTLAIPWADVAGGVLKRCYSLASAPGSDPAPKVTVKRVAGGRASNWLNDHVHAGDVIGVQAPAGRFVLGKGDGPLVLFAGGSGITPIISIIKTALARTGRTATLVFANRDARSIIFEAELAALSQQHGLRLAVRHRLDDRDGFMTREHVAREVVPGATYFLCGPGPFMDLVEAALLGAGAPADHVHVERFLSAPDPVAHPKDASPPPGGDVPSTIGVEHEGAQRDVPYQSGQTLLEAAIAGGVDAPYSCKEGFCGCCAALLLEGTVRMDADDALTPEAKKRGLILACQARPTSASCKLRFVEY